VTGRAESSPPMQWETAIATWDPQPLYRGYPVDELAESRSFLEVAFLLMTGELPNEEQHADWQALLFDGLTLPASVHGWLKRVPEQAATIDVVQAALARCRLGDVVSPPSTTRAAADAFPHWLGFVTGVVTTRSRLIRGEPPVEPRADLTFGAQLWWLMQGREPVRWTDVALERLLVVCAEHGFTGATWAVRAAAANHADLSTSLQAGLAVAQGARAGSAASASLDVLASVRTPDRAVSWVEQMTKKQRLIAGFQHRLYRVGDPRTDWIAPLCKTAAEKTGHRERETLAEAIEQAVWDQRKVLPAVVWPAARLLDYLGVPQDLFGPLFVLSRMAGWAAHDAEQRAATTAPVIRARYLGPEQRPLHRSTERT
jgi:citrate synthase